MSDQLKKVMKSYTEEGSKDNKVPAVVIKKEADIEFNEICSEEKKDAEIMMKYFTDAGIIGDHIGVQIERVDIIEVGLAVFREVRQVL